MSASSLNDFDHQRNGFAHDEREYVRRLKVAIQRLLEGPVQREVTTIAAEFGVAREEVLHHLTGALADASAPNPDPRWDRPSR